MDEALALEKDNRWTTALAISKVFFIFSLAVSLLYIWKLEVIPAGVLFPSHGLAWSVKLDLLMPEVLLGLVGLIAWKESRQGRMRKAIAESILGSISIVLCILYPLLMDILPKH